MIVASRRQGIWKNKSFWRKYVKPWVMEFDSSFGDSITRFSYRLDWEGIKFVHSWIFCRRNTVSYTNDKIEWIPDVTLEKTSFYFEVPLMALVVGRQALSCLGSLFWWKKQIVSLLVNNIWLVHGYQCISWGKNFWNLGKRPTLLFTTLKIILKCFSNVNRSLCAICR